MLGPIHIELQRSCAALTLGKVTCMVAGNVVSSIMLTEITPNILLLLRSIAGCGTQKILGEGEHNMMLRKTFRSEKGYRESGDSNVY